MFFPFKDNLYKGTFIERPNRFIIVVRLDNGEVVQAHLQDPGRLKELLLPDAVVWLRHVRSTTRKTEWSAVLCEASETGTYVSIDTSLPNEFMSEALKQKQIPAFNRWDVVQREYTYGKSRWDFLLQKGTKQLLVEVKSVTLVKSGIAYFPDAPTLRGTKHVNELISIQKENTYETAVLFVVQREDASHIEPAHWIDKAFANALTLAQRKGVQLIGQTVVPTPEGIRLGGAIEVNVEE